MSPYQAYGELEKVLGAPKLKFTRPIDSVSREALAGAERDLRDLAEAAQPVGDPSAHPWRDTTRTFYSEQDTDTARDILDSLRRRLARVVELAEQARRDFSLPPVNTFADVHTAAAVATVLARSPGAPLVVLHSEAWNSPPSLAVEIVGRGRALNVLCEEVEGKFTAGVLEQEHAAEIEFVEAKENSLLRFLNFLSGRFRAVKSRWLGYRLPSYQATLLEQSADMRKVDALRRERAALKADDAQARELFGALWQGEASDWDALDGYIRWVVEFRGVCVANKLQEQAVAVAARPHPDVSVVESLRDEAGQAARELDALRSHVGWQQDYLASAPISEIAERVEALHQNLNLAPRWAAFEGVREKVAAGLAAELLDSAGRGEAAFADLAAALRRAFFQRWLGDVVQGREPLRRFTTLTHEQRIAEFKTLDQGVLLENRADLVRSLRDRVQTQLREAGPVEALRFLRPQLTRQRGLSPLRMTFQKSYAAIRAIKPVLPDEPAVRRAAARRQGAGLRPGDLRRGESVTRRGRRRGHRARPAARGGRRPEAAPADQLLRRDERHCRRADGRRRHAPVRGQREHPGGVHGRGRADDAAQVALPQRARVAHQLLERQLLRRRSLHLPERRHGTPDDAGLSFEYVADGVYEGKGLNMAEAQARGRRGRALASSAKERAASRTLARRRHVQPAPAARRSQDELEAATPSGSEHRAVLRARQARAVLRQESGEHPGR